MKITLENVRNVVLKSLKLSEDELTDDVSLIDQIGIDSIETVELCGDLSDAFGVEIEIDLLKEADTVKKIAMLLEDSADSVKYRVKELISKTYFVDYSDIVDEEALSEQGFMDSKNILQLILLLELHFGIPIDIDKVSLNEIESVDKIAQYISEHQQL